MATVTVEGAYVRSGDNALVEIQYLKMQYTWTIKNNTTGSITAKLWVKRDSYGPTYGFPYTASIVAVNRDNGKTYTLKSVSSSSCPSIGTSYVLIAEGSADIPLNSSGAKDTQMRMEGKFDVPANGKLNDLVLPCTQYTNGDASQLSGSVLFTFPAQVSACGAPASFTVNGGKNGVVVPTGKFTVKWTAGTAGTNNKIKGYRIYWRNNEAGSNPTTGSYAGRSAVLSASTREYEIDLSTSVNSIYRGYTLKIGIITVGEKEGYDSSMKTATNTMLINTIPSAPSLTMDKKLYRPGDTITLTLSSSVFNSYKEHDEGKQTVKIGYDVVAPSSGPKNLTINSEGKVSFKLPSAEEITDSISKKYYFWGYDGLEYSSRFTLSVPISPLIDFDIKQTYTKLNAENYSSDEYPYSIENAIEVDNAMVNGNYTYTLYTSKYSNSDFSVLTGYSATKKGSEKTFGVTDVRKIISEYNPNILTEGCYYYYSVTYTSNLNEAQTKNSKTYYINPPAIKEIYNTKNGSVTGNSQHFYKDFSIKLYSDEGYNNVEQVYIISGDVGLSAGELVFSSNESGEKLISGSFNHPNLSPGNEYKIQYQLKNKNEGESEDEAYITPLITHDFLTRVPLLDVSESVNGMKFVITASDGGGVGAISDRYHIFTGKKLYFSIAGGGLTENMLSSYSISKEIKETEEGIEEKYYVIFPEPVGKTEISWDKDKFIFSLEGDKLYSLLYNNGEALEYTKDLVFTIVNDFGVEVTKSLSIYCTLKEETNIPNNTFNLLVKKTEEVYVNVKDLLYVKQSMPIYFTTSEFKLHATNCRLRFYCKDSDNKTYTLAEDIVLSQEGNLGYGDNRKISYSSATQLSINTLEKQLVSKEVVFCVDIIAFVENNSYTAQSIEILSKNVKRHTEPTFNIAAAKLKINETSKEIEIEFAPQQDLGLDYISETEGFLETNLLEIVVDYGYDIGLDNTGFANTTLTTFTLAQLYENSSIIIPLTLPAEKKEWKTLNVSLTLTSNHTYEGFFPTTYSYTTNTLLLFNILPTVAYRKNHLGINTQVFETVEDENGNAIIDGMLFINEYEHYNKIYLIPTNSGLNEAMVIDIKNKTINNFIIDGGEW